MGRVLKGLVAGLFAAFATIFVAAVAPVAARLPLAARLATGGTAG